MLCLSQDKIYAQWLIGPEEDKDSYLKRISVSKDFFLNYKVENGETFSEKNLDLPLLRPFDIDVKWMKVVYSNQKIAPWQGAVFWCVTDHDKNKIPLIQLRKCLKGKERFLGIYSKQEILAHEAIHAARVAFDEPKFEEILAYRVHKGNFRRFFGPIFREPKEVLTLLVIFLLAFVLQFFSVFLESYKWLWISGALFFMPIGFLCIRLMYLQSRFSKCLQKIKSIFPGDPEATAVRLTDSEILLFAKSKPKDILTYIKENSSFRWQIIKKMYFFSQQS